MKRTIVILLTLAMLLSLFPIAALAASNPFTDVYEYVNGAKNPFYDSILWAVEKGITTGYNDNTFRPNATCTRGQVVTFLWRAAGEPQPASPVNPFSDVFSTSPYYTAILWAAEKGITGGYADGTFRPNGSCTRAHVVTFLWRYENKPAPVSGVALNDLAGLNADFAAAIKWAASVGITTGYNDGTFRPNATCTRAHVVTFINRSANIAPPTPTPTGGDEKPVELTMWCIATESDAARHAYEAAVADMAAKHPNIKLTWEATPNQAYKAKVKAAARSNTLPDIFFTWSCSFLKDFVDAGKVYCLDEAYKAYADELKSNMLTNMTFGGKLYGVPTNMNVSGLFVNTELLNKISEKVPTTYEELLACCDKLVAAGIIPFGCSGKETWCVTEYLETIMMKTAGSIPLNDIFMAYGTWDNDKIAEAVDTFQSFIKKGYFDPDAMVLSNDETKQGFMDGKYAFYLNGSWNAADFYADPDFRDNVTFVGFPAIDAVISPTGDLLGGVSDTLAVSAASPNAKVAAAYTMELAKLISRYAYLDGSGIPAWKVDYDTSNINALTKSISDTAFNAKRMVLYGDTALMATSANTYLCYVDLVFGCQINGAEFVSGLVRDIEEGGGDPVDPPQPPEPPKPIEGDRIIGVSMPTADLKRWKTDGDNMKAQMEQLGYTVDLRFAYNDVSTQISQIETMINEGCKVLVIAPIVGESLGTVLAQAKEKGIPVIAYDRLIMNSDALSYYVTFDKWLVGVKQGEYIEQALDLRNAGNKTYNIEYVTGDPGDNSINFFFDGAMSILQKYVDAGTLVCPSGQVPVLKKDGSYDKSMIVTEGWASDKACTRFENILGTYYADGKPLHAVLASNDSTALGVEWALAGCYDNAVYPIITGQDCDIAIMHNLITGKQAMSVFKDTRTLVAQTVDMVEAIMEGKTVPINDLETYDNGTGIIPSMLCEPVVVTAANYYELLVESGYYTEDQLR